MLEIETPLPDCGVVTVLGVILLSAAVGSMSDKLGFKTEGGPFVPEISLPKHLLSKLAERLWPPF